MKRSYAGLAIAAVVAVGGWAWVTPAHAAPPTVTPSPGYDARLQASRAAQTYEEPAVRTSGPVHRRHVKRAHDGAHRNVIDAGASPGMTKLLRACFNCVESFLSFIFLFEHDLRANAWRLPEGKPASTLR